MDIDTNKETCKCIMCGVTSTDPKEMYVLEDKKNKKIYLRCKKCEKEGSKNIFSVLNKQTNSMESIPKNAENFISVLTLLDNKAKQFKLKNNADEYGKRGLAITKLLNQIENDFGIEYMIDIFIRTSKQLGHNLGPLDSSIVTKLIDNGFEIKNVSNIVKYKK